MSRAQDELQSDSPDDGRPGVRPGSRDTTLVVHGELRAGILSGELKPLTWVSQVQLAKNFGVSRGPVREALRLLEREGLIEAAVNRRARVAPISIADLEELYALRIVIEALAIRLSVPAFSDAELAERGAMLDELDELADTDVGLWESLHRRFHQAMVAHGGERFVGLIDRLHDHSERYRRAYITGNPRAWSVGAAEHRAILEAARRREAVVASRLLARHLSRTALTVVSLVSPEREPGIIRGALRQVIDDTPNG